MHSETDLRTDLRAPQSRPNHRAKSRAGGSTLFDKIWKAHVVARRPDGKDLLYIDRIVLDEVRAPYVFEQLRKRGIQPRRPDLAVAVMDHLVPSSRMRTDGTNPDAREFIEETRRGSIRNGIRLLDLNDGEQGISHVAAPEVGMVFPGATHVSADSHAPTVGGIGTAGFGCGIGSLVHLLATQVLPLEQPPQMLVNLDGRLSAGVGAKDIILHAIRRIGVEGARGYAVEFSGSAMLALPVEGRFTLCNMAVEMGARTAVVAPDDAAFEWLRHRVAPSAAPIWERAVRHWRSLRSDEDADFDRVFAVDCNSLEPQITWGTDPAQVIPVSGRVPGPDSAPPDRKDAHRQALAYMGLEPGAPLMGLAINRVFIGSCTNGWLSDLESAARVLRGRRVAGGVRALVVPGSSSIRQAAEAQGLDRVFTDAGFVWGESGCSMCTGANGDRAEPGERTVSSTNRNFQGRQGRLVRTHLASPAMAAAAAVAGKIVDVRRTEPEALL